MLSSHIPHLRFIWLIVASMIAGVMNAMAGGGSFVSFPAMLGMGIPPVQANATNTVALWPGQLTSVIALRKDIRRDLLPAVILTTIVGGAAGAEVLLHTRQQTFLMLIPWLILTGTLLFGVSAPVSKWLRQRSAHAKQGHHSERPIPFLGLCLGLLPVCFYIGYFGAGAGFLIMTTLALFGVEDMYQLNAMKVLAAGLSNLVATITFIISGAVLWHYCLIAMVFAGLGGFAGAKWARRTNPAVLRGIVVVTGCLVAAYFFWKQARG
jgi:uncharacterized membrane protein YfcA